MRSIDRRLLVVILAVLVLASGVGIVQAVSSTAERPEDNASGTVSDKRGVEISLNDDNLVVSANISSQTSGATKAYLTQTDGSVIEKTDIASGTAEFDSVVNSGTYYIVVDDQGSSYTQGVNNEVTFPYESSFVDITAGVFGGTDTLSGAAFTIRSVTATEYDSEQPVVDNSSASPSGGTLVQQSPVELSIDVSDADFPTSQGDSVNVTFYDASDDTEIGTETLTSNGTATASWSSVVGGDNNWYAVANDSYGNSVQSQTFTFNAPSEVEIRDEETQELITDSDVTLEFYQQSNNADTIEETNVTDGTGDMTGLPADESFIAVADADGYADRRIYIDSLIETQTIYLLNESTERVNIEFEIDDFSGEYQEADTILVIERNINGNWTPIQGDFFGAAGRFEATLKKDIRHRMRLVDIESGEERRIGTVTPQSSGVRTITVDADGSVSIAEEFEQIFAQPAVASVPAGETTDFAVEIQEGDTTITSYNIEVTVMNETAERQLATRSGSGTATEAFAFNLSADAGSTLVATVNYQTADGESGSVTLSKTIRENYPGAEGLLGGLTSIGDVLSDDSGGASGASMFAAVFLSLLVTGAVARVSTSVESIGISALGSVTGFAILGWIPMSTLFAATVAFGAMIVLRRGI